MLKEQSQDITQMDLTMYRGISSGLDHHMKNMHEATNP